MSPLSWGPSSSSSPSSGPLPPPDQSGMATTVCQEIQKCLNKCSSSSVSRLQSGYYCFSGVPYSVEVDLQTGISSLTFDCKTFFSGLLKCRILFQDMFGRRGWHRERILVGGKIARVFCSIFTLQKISAGTDHEVKRALIKGGRPTIKRQGLKSMSIIPSYMVLQTSQTS